MEGVLLFIVYNTVLLGWDESTQTTTILHSDKSALEFLYAEQQQQKKPIHLFASKLLRNFFTLFFSR